MKICFYAFQSLPIHARSLEERPLGGTETGLIRVSQLLAQKGHQVVVVTSHTNPLPHNQAGGPIFIRPQMLGQVGAFDAFVAIQYWQPLLNPPPSRKLFFWTGDGPEQFSNLGIGDPRLAGRITKMFTVSTWHNESLTQKSGFPIAKTTVVGNGVHPPFFDESLKTRIRRNPKRLIYTSAPYRGLELAAKYFQALKKQIPDLEFHIFSGLSIYDREEAYQGAHQFNFEKLKTFLQQMPGVVLHGNVVQKQLAEEYAKSRVLLYPNTVNETCCITALEAQAAGCVVVASANSALPESVGNGGAVIQGEVGSESYSKSLLEIVYRFLTDDQFFETYSRNGRTRIMSEHTWQNVSDRIERELA